MIYFVTNQKQLFETDVYKLLEIKDALNMLLSWELIQFDIETTGRDPHICKILSLQFGNRKADTQIVIDATTVSVILFKDILENKLLIGHNLKFDLQFLYNYSIIPLKVYDTMIVEQFTHLGFDPINFKVNLKAVLQRYCNINIDKSIREEINNRGLDTDVIVYGAGDVMYLEDVRDKQIKYCKKIHALKGMELENAFVPVIAYLEWCGIKLDVNQWHKKMADNEQKKLEALKALNQWVIDKYHRNGDKLRYEIIDSMVYSEEIGGEKITYKLPKNAQVINTCKENNKITVIYKKSWDFIKIDTQGDLFSGFDMSPKCTINWGSAEQTIPFFKMLGFDTRTKDKKTNKNKDSVSDKILSKQKGIADDFLKLYFIYKEKFKDCSTYGQNYIDAINPKTNRIHTVFRQLGCNSGRMSCGDSKNPNKDLALFKKLPLESCKYVQIQNLPADDITRNAFIAEEGNLFCSCDYSALESRLGADIYNEKEMLHEFLYGSGDMHSLCAKLVFHEELKDIEVKDIADVRPDLRKKVKPIEFSQQFGGGANAVMNSLGCSKDEAEKFVKAYADGFKDISKFKKIGSEFVRNNGYIIICKYTGHRLNWEDFEKWRTMENDPYMNYKYTKKELDEHKLAAAKWDRLALNVVTQGTGIIILKHAMVMFFRWIVKNNLFKTVKICDLVHDEACIEFPETMPEVADILKRCMEKAASIYCKKLPIPAKPEIGNHWIH